MPHRPSLTRRLTCWGFVAALLLKSAVPMLASAAAGLQGKAIAEVCDVYGVDTSTVRAHSHHDAHGGHGMHALPAGADAVPHASDPGPGGDPAPPHGAARVGHGDHCALAALAFALAGGDLPVGPPSVASTPLLPARTAAAGIVDPVARWAAQLRHGPPLSS